MSPNRQGTNKRLCQCYLQCGTISAPFLSTARVAGSGKGHFTGIIADMLHCQVYLFRVHSLNTLYMKKTGSSSFSPAPPTSATENFYPTRQVTITIILNNPNFDAELLCYPPAMQRLTQNNNATTKCTNAEVLKMKMNPRNIIIRTNGRSKSTSSRVQRLHHHSLFAFIK